MILIAGCSLDLMAIVVPLSFSVIIVTDVMSGRIKWSSSHTVRGMPSFKCAKTSRREVKSTQNCVRGDVRGKGIKAPPVAVEFVDSQIPFVAPHKSIIIASSRVTFI